jgi:hypothetical protein
LYCKPRSTTGCGEREEEEEEEQEENDDDNDDLFLSLYRTAINTRIIILNVQ